MRRGENRSRGKVPGCLVWRDRSWSREAVLCGCPIQPSQPRPYSFREPRQRHTRLAHLLRRAQESHLHGAMFPTLVRRLAQAAKEPVTKRAPLTVASNPHQARKVWPPNFKDLNHQQQLRLEKKYKRRIFLASRSPRWQKGIKFAQLATIAGMFRPGSSISMPGTDSCLAALVWLLFYSEFEWWGQRYKPSEEVRSSSWSFRLRAVSLTCTRCAAMPPICSASSIPTNDTNDERMRRRRARLQRARSRSPSEL